MVFSWLKNSPVRDFANSHTYTAFARYHALLHKMNLARISHKISTAAAQTGMSTALRSVGLLDVLSSTSAEPSVALAEMRQMRLVSTPVCAASLRNLVRNAG